MRVLLKFVIYFLLFIAIIAIIASIALKSFAISQMAKGYIIDLVREESGYDVHIEDIYFSLPMNAYISSATIFDEEGKIASISDLEVNIWPSIYMLKEINITNISASNMVIYKVPDEGKSHKKQRDEHIYSDQVSERNNSQMLSKQDYSSLIPDIIIYKANIDRIEIFDPASNKLAASAGTYTKNTVVSDKPIIAFDFAANSNLLFSKNNLELNVHSKLLDHVASKDIALDSRISLKLGIDLQETELSVKEGEVFLLAKDIAGEDITLKLALNGVIDASGGELKGIIKLSNNDNKILFDSYNFPDLNLKAKFNNDAGNILGKIEFNQGNFYGSSDLTFKDNVINLPNFDARSSLSSKQVSMTYDLNKKILSADVNFKSSDLKDLQEFLPYISNGKIALNAKYNLDFNKDLHSLKLYGNLDDFNYKLLHINYADIKANFTDLILLEFDNLEVGGDFIEYDGLLISKVKIKATENKFGNKTSSSDKTTYTKINKQSESNILDEEVLEGQNWINIDINKDINIQTDVEMIAPHSISISSSKNLVVSKNKIGLEIKSLNGYLNKAVINLPKPIFMDIAKEFNINAPSIGIGQGKLSLNANISELQKEKLLKGDLELSNISFNDLFKGGVGHIFDHSQTNGQITMTGSLSDPVIESKIDMSNISLISIQDSLDDIFDSESDLSNASITLDKIKAVKRLSKGGVDKINSDKSLKIHSIATRNRLSGSVFINLEERNIASVEVDIPILMDLSQGDLEIYQDKEVDISFKLSGKVELLSLLPTPPGHNIKGILEGGIKARGSLNNLNFSGNMELSEGKYSYKPLGIRIIDISSKIVANGQSLRFLDIYMADKFGNTITGAGAADIGKNFPYKMDLATEKFELLNSPHLQGSIAGKVHLVGDHDSSKLFGNLLIGPMEIKIPERIQKDFPELNVTQVIEVDDFPDKLGHDSKKGKPEEYQICFDISVETYDQVKHKLEKILKKTSKNAAKRPADESSRVIGLENIQNKMVFVRGRGVDTRLQGELKITGCSENLLINGKLSSVDGKYSEFGHELNIERGVLKFDGAIPPSPFLDIVSTLEEDGKEFRISLGGPINSPQISISSNHAMEQEEALSMILFGSNPDNISAFQAFQLASSMRRLSGGGDNSDILGASKKAIGIDEISFRNSSKNPENSAVAVGKYLSDKFYIEIEKGIEDDTKTKIEVEILPQITLEAFTESTGNSSVGVNWKYDY